MCGGQARQRLVHDIGWIVDDLLHSRHPSTARYIPVRPDLARSAVAASGFVRSDRRSHCIPAYSGHRFSRFRPPTSPAGGCVSPTTLPKRDLQACRRWTALSRPWRDSAGMGAASAASHPARPVGHNQANSGPRHPSGRRFDLLRRSLRPRGRIPPGVVPRGWLASGIARRTPPTDGAACPSTPARRLSQCLTWEYGEGNVMALDDTFERRRRRRRRVRGPLTLLVLVCLLSVAAWFGYESVLNVPPASGAHRGVLDALGQGQAAHQLGVRDRERLQRQQRGGSGRPYGEPVPTARLHGRRGGQRSL